MDESAEIAPLPFFEDFENNEHILLTSITDAQKISILKTAHTIFHNDEKNDSDQFRKTKQTLRVLSLVLSPEDLQIAFDGSEAKIPKSYLSSINKIPNNNEKCLKVTEGIIGKAHDYIKSKPRPDNFYSPSLLQLINNLESVNDIPDARESSLLPIIMVFVEDLVKIKHENITYWHVMALSRIYATMEKRVQSVKATYVELTIIANIDKFILSIKSNPNILIKYFFTSWFRNGHVAQTNILVHHFSQDLFNISLWKFNIVQSAPDVLSKAFDFFIFCPGLVDNQSDRFNIITFLVRAVTKFTVFPKLDDLYESMKHFSNTLLLESKGTSFPSIRRFFLLYQDETYRLIRKMEKAKGAVVDKKNANIDRTKTVSFKEQAGTSITTYPLDEDMETVYVEHAYKDNEQANKYISRIPPKARNIWGNYTCMFVLSRSLLGVLSTGMLHQDTHFGSFAKFLFQRVMLLWVKFIFTALKYELIMNKTCMSIGAPPLSSSFKTVAVMINKHIHALPEETIGFVATNVAQAVFERIMEGELTLSSAELLTSMEGKENEKGGSSGHFYMVFLTNLYGLFVSQAIPKFFSVSEREVRNALSVLLFLIRTAYVCGANANRPAILCLVANYKVIVSNLFIGLKKTTNQNYSIRGIARYIEAMRMLNFDSLRINIKADVLRYLTPSAAADAIPLIPLLIKNREGQDIIEVFSPILINALLEGNRALRDEAAMTIIKFTTVYEKTLPTEISQEIVDIFTALRKVIPTLSPDVQDAVTMGMSKLSYYFTAPQANDFSIHWNINDVRVDIVRLLKNIDLNSNETEEEAFDLYNLLRTLMIDALTKIQNNEAVNEDAFILVLDSLLRISRYDFIKKRLRKFIASISGSFRELFVSDKSSLYLFALLQIAGMQYDEVSKDAAREASAFLNGLKLENDFISSEIDDMIGFFSPQVRNAAILVGLSIFTKYFPNAITLSHIRAAIVSTCDTSPLTSEMPGLLKRMLKVRLAHMDENEKKELWMMVYGMMGTINIGSRNVLYSLMAKSPAKLKLKSLDDISIYNNRLYSFQQLCAALYCGIEGKLEMTNNVRAFFLNFIMQKEDQNDVIEALSRKITISVAFIENPYTVTFLKDESQSSSITAIANFMYNALSSRFKPIQKMAKRGIKIIGNLNDVEYAISRQIHEYVRHPEKVFVFRSPQPERISFYKRLAKRFPMFVSVNGYLNMLINFCEFPQERPPQQVKFLQNLIHLAKILTCREVLSNPHVCMGLMEKRGQSSYLEYFLNSVCKLYDSQDIPFMVLLNKYVKKFIFRFLKEYLMLISEGRAPRKPQYIHLIGSMLADTHDQISIQACYNFFDIYQDPSSYPYEILDIYRKAQKAQFVHLKDQFTTYTTALMHHAVSAVNSNDKENPLILTQVHEYFHIYVDMLYLNEAVTPEAEFVTILSNNAFYKSGVYYRFIDLYFKSYKGLNIARSILFERDFDETSMKFAPTIIKNDAILIEDMKILFTKITKTNKNFTFERLDSIFYLLHKELAEDMSEYYNTACNYVLRLINSPNEQIVYGCLKIAIFVGQKVKIPYELFEEIFNIAFTTKILYQDYFRNLTFKFLDKVHEYINELSQSNQMKFLEFLFDKYDNIHDLTLVASIITCVPELSKYMEYSIAEVSNQYIKKHPQEQTDSKLIQLCQNCIDVADSDNSSQYVIEATKEMCLEVLKPIIPADNSRSLGVKFAKFVINKKIPIGIDILKLVDEKSLKANGFAIICASVSTLDASMIQEMTPHYDSAIEYAMINPEADHVLTEALVKVLVDTKNPLYMRYVMMIYGLILQKVDDPDFKHMKHLLSVADFFINQNLLIDVCEFLLQIWDRYQEKANNNDASSVEITAFVIRSIPLAQPEYHIHIMQKVIEAACRESVINGIFASLPGVISSENVPIENKERITEMVASCSFIGEHKNALFSVAHLMDLNDIPHLNVGPYICTYIFMITECASTHIILKCHAIIDKYAPKDTVERMQYFMEQCPLTVWNEVRFISILLSCVRYEDNIWPYFALFPESARSFEVELGEYVFSKILQVVPPAYVIDFMVKMTAKKIPNAVAAILRALVKNNIKIDQMTAEPAVKLSDMGIFYDALTDEAPWIKAMSTRDVQQMAFATARPRISGFEAASCALTVLHSYEAANVLFSEIRCPGYVGTMKSVNERFLYANLDDIYGITSTFLMPKTRAPEINKFIATAITSFNSYDTGVARVAIAQAFDSICPKLRNNEIFFGPELERLLALTSYITMISDIVDGRAMPTMPRQCMVYNPMYRRAITKAAKIISQKVESSPMITAEPAEHCLMQLQADSASRFEKIMDYSSRGLACVTSDYITSFLEKNGQRSSNLRDDAFLAVLYNMYSIQPTEELFKTVIIAIGHQISSSNDDSQIDLAICRFLILSSLSKDYHLEVDSNFIAKIINAFQIPTLFANWVPMLAEVTCKIPWLFQFSKRIFAAFPQSTIASAFASENTYIKEWMTLDKNDETVLATRAFNALKKLNPRKIEAMMRRKSVIELIEEFQASEAQTISEDDHLQEMLNELYQEDQQNFMAHIESMKGLNEDKISALATEITGINEDKTGEKLEGIINDFNLSLPLPVGQPLQGHMGSQILYMRNDFVVLGENVVSCDIVTATASSAKILVRKGARDLTTSFQRMLYMLRRATMRSYSTRSESIFPSLLDYELIAPEVSAAVIESEVFSLYSLYMDCINANLIEYEGGKDNCLKDRFMKDLSLGQFINARETALNSFAAAAAINLIWDSPYPLLDSVTFSGYSINVDVNLLQSSKFILNEADDTKGSCFRLSPNIRTLFGEKFEPRLLLKIAATCRAFVERLEDTRAAIDIAIVSINNIQELLEKRMIVELRVLELSPPYGSNITSEECCQWYANLENLIADASCSEKQPAISIPWF